MQDWTTHPEEVPTVDEFINERMNMPWTPHKEKKHFIIERRYIGPPSEILYEMYERQREWYIYRKYKTERAQSEALKTCIRRKDSPYAYERLWEYRIP